MFQFDVEELKTSGVFISGAPGSGKSTFAFFLADQLIRNNFIVYAFDPSQAWKTKSSIPKYVEVTEKIPFLILQKESTVYDISLLSPLKQQNFVENFCRILFNERARSMSRPQTFLIFEEAHLYIPKGDLQKEVAQELLRIITVGRNYNIRFALLTQFPTMIDKMAIKYCKLKFFGYCDDADDIKYLRSFLGEDANSLNGLDPGEFVYCCGPSKQRIKIQPFQKK
jgi:DNA helicase HerA-like ATPase